MRKQQKTRGIFFGTMVRTFTVLAVAMICAAILLACSQWVTGGNSSDGENKGNASSVQSDAYEAKLQYYQAQVKALTNQLTEMEQKMYLTQSQYEEQLHDLEQRIEEAKPSGDGNSTEQQPDASSDPSDTHGGSSDKNDPPIPSDEKELSEYTYRLENGEAILTSYRGWKRDVVVPAAVDGYRVVGLDDSVFAGSKVTGVTIPETVKSLGWFVFYECENLEKVVLPAGIDYIGYASFDGCPPTLCLHVDQGSYAEQYAISFGLHYQNQV